MKPQKHKEIILDCMAKIRYQICLCFEEGHLAYPPKSLRHYEEDIETFCNEIERTEFVERSKK